MTKNKMACALSAIALVSSLGTFGFAGSAWAATCPTAASLETEGQVSNESELRYAMLGDNDVSEVKVANDFNITCDTYPDYIKKDFTLDLNGNTITSSFGWAFDIESSGKTLTIKDTSEEADGTYVFPEGGFWVAGGANLTIESGNIQSTSGGRRAILFDGGGKLTINGGNISTTPSVTSDGNGRTIMVYNSDFEMNSGTVSVAKAEGGQDGVGVFYIQDSEVLINDGEILASEGSAFRAIKYSQSSQGSQITFKDGRILGGNEVIRLESSSFTMEGGEMYATGIGIYTDKDSEFSMSDGYVVSENSYALAGNGSIDSTTGEPLHGNTVWNLSGGTIMSQGVTAIYQSQVGDTYLGSNLNVYGAKAGIEIRAGDLTIEGATIAVTGDYPYDVVPSGDGASTTGAAIAVAQHTTKKPINVNIAGGSFVGPVAFSEANPQENPAEYIENVSVTITDGEFEATGDGQVVESSDVEAFISGGTFNKQPDASYIVEGYEAYPARNMAIWNVLPITHGAGKDSSDDEGDSDAIAEELENVANDILGELHNNYNDLEGDGGAEFTTGGGAKFWIKDLGYAKNVLKQGRTIIAALESNEYDINEVAEEAEQYLKDGMVPFGVMEYWIDLNETDGHSGGWLGNVIEIPYAITMTYDVSEAPEVPEGMTREWTVARLHWTSDSEDPEISYLPATYDEETGLVSYENDKFSAFIIAYKDSANGSETEGERSSTAAPATGTMTVAETSAAGAAIVTAVIVGLLTTIVSFAYLIRRR